MSIDVTLQARLNGGAPLVGGLFGNLNDVVQLTAANKAEWPTLQVVRWELYDYPEFYLCPIGWSVSTDDALAPTYYRLGIADPPPFSMTDEGPYKTRVIVGDRYVDERTFLKVRTASGAELIAAEEDAQFGGNKRKWVAPLNRSLLLATSGGGAPLSDDPPANVGATFEGVSAEASRSDHVHAHGAQIGGSTHAVAGASAGFMSVSDKTKLDTYPATYSTSSADALSIATAMRMGMG